MIDFTFLVSLSTPENVVQGLLEKSKIDNVISQVEDLKMPLNGDEMRKEQIALIKKWRDQKFPKHEIVDPKPVNWDENPAKKRENQPSPGC